MSRIYFHSEQDDAEVRGWERAWAVGLCSDLLAVALRLDGDELFSSRPSPLRQIIDGYPRQTPPAQFERTVRTWLSGMSDGGFLVQGKLYSVFTVALNTAMVMGSDPVRLLARLHGQCEIHCYVEGQNRAWLAGIIEQGRKSGIMRPDSGWEDVVTLLRLREDGPVVTSYSVCEQFPNSQAAQWSPPEDEDGNQDWDAWYEIGEAERWRMGIEGLRAGVMGKGLEMRPDAWADYYFGNGMNGFAIRAFADALVKDEQ